LFTWTAWICGCISFSASNCCAPADIFFASSSCYLLRRSNACTRAIHTLYLVVPAAAIVTMTLIEICLIQADWHAQGSAGIGELIADVVNGLSSTARFCVCVRRWRDGLGARKSVSA
jgi:hypothetical protein